ncbi:MAG: glycosyltransferase family 4 protein [Chitinophagaceae bacterium]
MKKKIAINCWVLRNKQLDGIGYFTINTISNIIQEHPDVEFLILCDTNFTEDYFNFPNATKHLIFPALRHPLLYLFFMELVVPFFLAKHKPQLFIGMEGFLSLFASCKQIPIIHDINFEHNPKDVALKNRIYFQFFFPRFAKKATRIATISAYSKQDIASLYKVSPSKIDNISCGINSNFAPLQPFQIEQIQQKWTKGKPYFFFVGSMHPRKNIQRLIQAFSLFKQQTQSDIQLVLAGAILWKTGDMKDCYEQSSFKNDIIFTGRLSDSDLQQLLGAALALSFVPTFEGFGLPIVEAFQAQVPVICSNVTSMPEVAGNAALLVNPFNIQEISNAMQQMANNPSLRSDLIAKGLLQKNKFSWKNTAQLLWQTIEKVI